MKLSLDWLNDYVEASDFKKDPEPLVKALTDAGLEVEAFEMQAKDFDHVVVGVIEKLGKHPDADKLTYCDVRVSDSEVLKIICGAKNHKEGDKVCVAKIGAVLPGNFKIKKSKIRGVESFGMLCSAKELNLSDSFNNDGIVILPQDSKVGQPLAECLNLDDVIVEVNVTPNRADCLSHLGLAREVSVLFSRELKNPKQSEQKLLKSTTKTKVELTAPELCPRYIAHGVTDVQVSESPEWLKKRLEAVGVNSINNIVDITNFIMMDTGQPLHAFDADKINGDTIHVRTAKPKEPFETLDGTKLNLTGEELVIADSNGVLALAGVIGGKGSGVSETTKNIVLEAAYFTPSTVRKTSRHFGIETDSSYRFSRGADISNVKNSMDYALSLIQDLAQGQISDFEDEAYPKKLETFSIEITQDFIEKKIGLSIDSKRIEEEFSKLGFEFSVSEDSDTKKTKWVVTPKSYRHDINIKEDLVEEVARLIGYDQIPEVLPSSGQNLQKDTDSYGLFRQLKTHLNGLGFTEVLHYNFFSSAQEMDWSKEILFAVDFKEGREVVKIKNPLSADTSLMRMSCVPQFITNFLKNYRLGEENGAVFEIGKSHLKTKDGYKESNILSLGVWSNKVDQKTLHKKIIGQVQELFNLWNIAHLDFRLPSENIDSRVIHPKTYARLFKEGKDLGFVYSLHPKFHKENKITSCYSGIEINLDEFLKGQPRVNKFKSFSRYPVVERDFSVTVPKDYDYSSIFKTIKKSAPNYFKDLELVEEYEGKGVKEGEVSLTMKAKFQSSESTLEENEIKTLHTKILKGLENL